MRCRERYRQLRRMLALSELLRDSRFGVDVEYALRQLADRTDDQWCWRTIKRDLEFLESCGLVDCVEGSRPARWKWCGERSPLANVSREVIPIHQAKEPGDGATFFRLAIVDVMGNRHPPQFCGRVYSASASDTEKIGRAFTLLARRFAETPEALHAVALQMIRS